MSDVSKLVSKAQAGDLNSYEALVRRFEASAFGHAFSILGDSQLAQDAVQEAFIASRKSVFIHRLMNHTLLLMRMGII